MSWENYYYNPDGEKLSQQIHENICAKTQVVEYWKNTDFDARRMSSALSLIYIWRLNHRFWMYLLNEKNAAIYDS